MMKALGVTRAVIAIEENKPEAITKLALMCDSGIEVATLKAKYPQGAEKQLIYAVSKRKVPAGGLPMDAGVVVMNTHSSYAVALAVRDGIPLFRRAMTVSGQAVGNPGNFWVRTGTPYEFVYEHCKGGNNKQPVKVLSGGPMMGFAQADLDAVVVKGTSALLFLTEDEISSASPSACINCGSCAKACPMNLMPMFIDAYTINNDYDKVSRYNVMSCIECGCCTYICPAKRPLVQSIRLAKKQLKARGTK